jgi:hypothetical protein
MRCDDWESVRTIPLVGLALMLLALPLRIAEGQWESPRGWHRLSVR